MVESGKVATIVLGGGAGTRLFPLTKFRCKPAVPFGQCRLIDIPLSNALHAGLRSIFVVTQFLSRSLHHHLLKTYRLDPFSGGFVQLLTPEQKHTTDESWYQGTADAVRQNCHHLAESTADYFLILSGDQLYHMDFVDLVGFAVKKNADCVIACLPTSLEDASRMGIVRSDVHDRIMEFVEKPKVDRERLMQPGLPEDRPLLGSMGIYLFKRRVLFDLLNADPRGDFGCHLIPTQVAKGGTFAYRFDGYWEDIGTIESFHRANMALTHSRAAFDCYNEMKQIFSAHQSLPAAKILGGKVSESIFCPGTHIDAEEIASSVLGPRTVVGKGTALRRTVVFGSDFYKAAPHQAATFPERPSIGENVTIEGAIIDKNALIGNGVKLVNSKGIQNYDGDGIVIRDGIIVVTRGAVIPEGFEL